MLKTFWSSLDKKYAKICLYASVTVIVTLIVLCLLYWTTGFWSRLWTIFTAVLKPLVVGGIISFLLSPIVDRIEGLFSRRKSHKWDRPLAILLSFIIVLAVIAFILVILILTIYKNISAINFESLLSIADLVQSDVQSLISAIEEQLKNIGISMNQLGGYVAGFLSGVKNVVTTLFFGCIFSVYFMIDGARINRYWKRAFRIITSKKEEERFERFWSDADRIFSGYLRGQFIDALLVSVITGVVFLILGIPDALLIALLVGIGNLIPYVGPIVGYGSLLLICLPQQAFTELVSGIIALVVIMIIDGNVINPRLLSSNIKIHPLLVVAALIGGSALGGFIGMLVAVPVAALLKLEFDRFLADREKEASS